VLAPAAPYTIRGDILEIRTLFRRFEIDLPNALSALAFALRKSPYVGHREVGQQIQRIAERPTRDSWPE
jgi:hypothetical protein